MKAWLFLAAWAFAAPALAVPPVLPAPLSQALVEEYIQATSTNDIVAYGKLFSPEAEIVIGPAAALTTAQWLEVASQEFTATRQTRFLEVFAAGTSAAGKPSTRITFTEEMRDCRPLRAECFGTFRNEAITVTDGKIVRLERAPDSSHRRTSPGNWTFYFTQ